METKIKNFMNGLSDKEKIVAIKVMAKTVHDNLQKKERALIAESSFNGDSKGLRGGKRTTLTARATNACEAYESSKTDLKLYVKYL